MALKCRKVGSYVFDLKCFFCFLQRHWLREWGSFNEECDDKQEGDDKLMINKHKIISLKDSDAF